MKRGEEVFQLFIVFFQVRTQASLSCASYKMSLLSRKLSNTGTVSTSCSFSVLSTPFSFHFLSPLLPLCPFSLSLLLINICSIQLGAIPKKWNCRNRPRTAEGDERFDSLIPPQHRRTVRETKDFEVYSSSLLFSLLFYDLQKKRNKTLMVNT